MYPLRLEELESRDLLSTSMSPPMLVLMRAPAPSGPVTEYSTALVMGGSYTGAQAKPEFMKAFARQVPLVETVMPRAGPTSSEIAGSFTVVEGFSQPPDSVVQPGGVEFHYRVPQPEMLLSQAPSLIAVATATESADPPLAMVVIRAGNPGTGLTQAPDLPRASVDPPSAGVAQRLSLAPVPRLDTLVGVSAFRVDPQTAAAVHTSGAWAVREPDGAAVANELAQVTPNSANQSPTVPRAAEADSGMADEALSLPQPQGAGAALRGLQALDITVVERGMQQFLQHLQGASEDLIGKRDKPGLGVWLVAGTAAVAACEMARRQMWGLRKGQPSFRSLAVEMNWIAGSPPDFPLGE
jgi:hypothetical protein